MLFQVPLFLARLRQVVTPIDDRSSSIWSFQKIQGRPLRRLPHIPALNTRLARERNGRANVLHTYVVAVLIHLIVGSEAETIANQHLIEDLR